MFTKHRLSAAVGIVLACSVEGVFAQNPNQVVDNESRVVEEVIVTALRRESSLQDTPIAVTAIDQKALIENDISDVTDLSGFVPNLVVSGQEDQSDIKIFIRGV